MRKTLCCEQLFGEILVFFHFFEILDSKFPDHLFAANLHSATYFTNHCYGKTLAAYVAQLDKISRDRSYQENDIGRHPETIFRIGVRLISAPSDRNHEQIFP